MAQLSLDFREREVVFHMQKFIHPGKSGKTQAFHIAYILLPGQESFAFFIGPGQDLTEPVKAEFLAYAHSKLVLFNNIRTFRVKLAQHLFRQIRHQIVDIQGKPVGENALYETDN